VPRGSFHDAPGATFSALGRLILDRLDRGVILLDAQGRVLDANAMARRVLHDRNGMQLRGGRLRFTDQGMNERVARLVAAQRGVPRGAAQAIASWVRHDEAPAYRVVVMTVPDDPDERGAALAILIFGPLERRYIALEVLTQVYGLTRAQAEVARSLFAGLSAEQVAAVLELSLNTVRTHLKHIFTKCEVQSQGELLQLLASGPQDL
jgi:DNA-binding CsgD family transcriptional regulator